MNYPGEMDKATYKKGAAEPETYCGFTQSIFFISKRYRFKYPLSKVDAIEKVKSIISDENFQFFGERYKIILHRPQYYDIWFFKNGVHHYCYHRPAYRIRNGYYEFRYPYTIGRKLEDE